MEISYNFTCHYITDTWEMKEVVLEAKKMDGHHSSENISQELESTRDWRFDFATSYILRNTVSVKCFRDGMVYLGSIEFISLRKPTPSTVLIGHMS
jgi:hypothetical protein